MAKILRHPQYSLPAKAPTVNLDASEPGRQFKLHGAPLMFIVLSKRNPPMLRCVPRVVGESRGTLFQRARAEDVMS